MADADAKAWLTEFVKEILAQVDHFKEQSHQATHLHKITEAENRAREALHAVEELQVRLAEKEGLLRSANAHLAEQQTALESLNLQISALKDEAVLAANAQLQEHQHFVDILKAQNAEESARLHERIRELEGETAGLRREGQVARERVQEVERRLAEASQGEVTRQRVQNGVLGTADPFFGAVADV